MKPSTVLAELPLASLEALAAAVAGDRITPESPRAVLSQMVGAHAQPVADLLRALHEQGFNTRQMATLLESAVELRRAQGPRQEFADLVLSGPDVPGVPTADTHVVVQGLFQQAESEVILVGYAFHNARPLFERLAECMRQRPGLRVRFHVDIGRKAVDTSLDAEIVRRFADEFRRRHWPWDPAPEVYYDPRALRLDARERASLHAKAIVVDRRQALITSANFTEAAQSRNIEAGIVVRDPALAGRIADYFAALRATGLLLRLPGFGDLEISKAHTDC